MPQTRDSLERQLTFARQELERFSNSLSQRGVKAEEHQLAPHWRTLRAKCRRLESRLRVIRAIAARDEEVAARKAEKAAAPPEPKAKSKGAEAPREEKAATEKGSKKKKQSAAAES